MSDRKGTFEDAAARASRWVVVLPLAGGALVWLMGAIAVHTSPSLEGNAFGCSVFGLSGAVVGLLARRGRRSLTLLSMLALGGGARFVLSSAWAYYSILLPLSAGLLASTLLGCGFLFGAWLARFVPKRGYAIAVLLLLLAGQLGFLLHRDGYLLLVHARPRAVAFGNPAPSWFFFTQGERVQGLTYIARQRVATEPRDARRILEKALEAATQVASGNESMVSAVASAQIEAGLFDDAVVAIQRIADPYQRFRCVGFTAVELAQAGAPEHANRLFAALLRDLQASGVLDERVSELHQLARRQMEAGFYEAAQATIGQNVSPPNARHQQLLFLAIDMARSGARAPAERLFDELFQSAEALPTPALREWGLFEMAYYQARSGLDEDARRSAERIRSPERRREILDSLAKPLSER